MGSIEYDPNRNPHSQRTDLYENRNHAIQNGINNKMENTETKLFTLNSLTLHILILQILFTQQFQPK